MSQISFQDASSPVVDPRRARRKRAPLRYRILEGKDLVESEIRALWVFRRQFVALKPHVPDALDFERFQRFLQRARSVVVANDAAGAVQIMLVLAVRDDAERRERILNWEYAFFAPEYRRDTRMYAIWWWLILRQAIEVRGWSVYCAAWAYPASYLVLRGNLPGLVSLQSAGLSEKDREVLLRFGRAVADGSFDETTGLRNMPTIPQERLDERQSRAIMVQARHEYLAANPRWAEGFTMAVVAPVSIASLGSIAWTVARRSLRHKKPIRMDEGKS